MSGPVVFISHFGVREGKLDDLRRLAGEMETHLHADKPMTVAYLMYLDEEGSTFTVVHFFPDADAMDRHFEGADERTTEAYTVMEPRGWEIYGQPSDGALEMMRQGAAAGGVTLTLRPDQVGGFLRLASA